MIPDVEGGPVQNPRAIREGQWIHRDVNMNELHPPIGRVRSIDAGGRYALVEWNAGGRSQHTLRELVPA